MARGARRRRPRPNDPRLLLPALAIALIVFLVAISHHSPAPPQPELPTPGSLNVGLGRPDPTTTRIRVGDLLQVRLAAKDGDRFGTVISQSNDHPVLEVTNGPTSPPMLRGVSKGSVVVTVLLEPKCPPQGVCRQYRRNLGAVRVVVDP
jgi:hypothetical protein